MPETASNSQEMDRFQRFLFLRTMPAFSEIPQEVAQVVAANTRPRSFAKGEHLYRSGVPAVEIQYIVRGECEIVRNGKPVRRLGPRTVVGGISALAGEEQGYDCIALQDMQTLAIKVEDSQEIFEDHFVFLKRVLRGTAREVLESRRKLGERAGFGPVSEPFAFPDRPFDLVERMAFLRKTFSFGDSEIDAIADLARAVQEVHLPKGEILWNVGDRSTYFLLPLRGVIDCKASDPDQHFQLGPGDSVGAIDSMADERRWYRAEVIEDLVAFRIDAEVLLEVLEDHFTMATSLLKAMATGILTLWGHSATS